MYTLATLFALAVVTRLPVALPEPFESLEIIRRLHESIRDVEFVFEGDVKFVGPASLLEGRPNNFYQRFQGSYSFRHDGATLLDVYQKGSGIDALLSRRIAGFLSGKVSETVIVPDAQKSPGFIEERRGSPAALDDVASAHRILYTWFFQNITDAQKTSCRTIGWDTIYEHRCLQIHITLSPNAPEKEKHSIRCWIDLERGGHPLKVERYVGPSLRSRAHKIELGRINPSQSSPIWLPVKGVFESFSWGGRYYGDAIFSENYGVVQTSIQLNQGLQDSVFSVPRRARLESSANGLTLRRDFDSELSKATHPRVCRTPLSVQADLNKKLAEADRQVKMLEASSPEQDPWNWLIISQAVLAVFGVGLLGGAALWKWRGR